MKRQTVCIQGLGFVGAAMAVAVANAKDSKDEYYFDVTGIDLANKAGIEKVRMLNKGTFPFETTDKALQTAVKNTLKSKNFKAGVDPEAFSKADVVLIDINLDVYYDKQQEPYLNLDAFKRALKTIGQHIKPDALVIVETTVPPGTCEKVVKPALESELKKRKLPANKLKIAHSYERVMPGDEYYNSIINYWRVYSGIDEVSSKACRDFLSKIVNVKDYPLVKLGSTNASETAKVLENSYRATNIAFMEEWGRFAEDIGINLFEVVNAVRKRPTHSNIRQPGFGVGGYCLTKDPYFAKLATKELFGLNNHDFEFSSKAVKLNNKMPLVSLNKLKKALGGISGKKILLLGVSYKQDVGDTRYSPSEIFAKEALKQGARLTCYDPLVNVWPEANVKLLNKLPLNLNFNAIVLTVAHSEFLSARFAKKLSMSKAVIFDTNNVLREEQIKILKNNKLMFIGRGDL
ncbi:MAG: nucleotide sugar dehydrogenase [Endomicrobium sp.]|jgi:nucleotide sugar dehydrogenase|nr:nucleotide sugar dehydrogenase [Endomicrobium sp.]